MFSCGHFSDFLFWRSDRKAECNVKERTRGDFKVHRWQNQSQWTQRWRSRDPWIWCCSTGCVRGRILRKIWAIPSIRRMPKKNKAVFQLVSGSWCGTQAEIQLSILKWGDRKTLNADPWRKEDGDESSSSISARKLVREVNTKNEFHNIKISNHQYLTKVLQYLWKKLGITTGYPTCAMEALTDMGSFMSSSMKATLHLGPDYTEDLEGYKNTNFKEIQNLCHSTQKLALEHCEEILTVKTIESASPSRTRSTLSHDQMIQWTKGKIHVHSDSVLCLGRCHFIQKQFEVQWQNFKCPLLLESYWESMEKHLNSSGISSQDLRLCRFFRRSRMICKSGTLNLRNSQIGSSSCQLFNDIDWTRKGNDHICISNAEKVKMYAKLFSQGHWTFLGRGDEKKWHGRRNYKPEGKWNSVASQMVQRFKETSHPVFKGKETIHFNADASQTELLFRIIHSVNQLSINGAVSNWFEQFGLTTDEKWQEKSCNRENPWTKEDQKNVNAFLEVQLLDQSLKFTLYKCLAPMDVKSKSIST